MVSGDESASPSDGDQVAFGQLQARLLVA